MLSVASCYSNDWLISSCQSWRGCPHRKGQSPAVALLRWNVICGNSIQRSRCRSRKASSDVCLLGVSSRPHQVIRATMRAEPRSSSLSMAAKTTPQSPLPQTMTRPCLHPGEHVPTSLSPGHATRPLRPSNSKRIVLAPEAHHESWASRQCKSTDQMAAPHR